MIYHQLTNRQLKSVKKRLNAFVNKHGDQVVTSEPNGIIRVFLKDRFKASINVKNILGIPLILMFDNESDYTWFINQVGRR